MITWEYPTVLSRSKRADLLKVAHSTLITQKKAREIIFAYLGEHEVKDLRFTTREGRGHCKYWPRDGEVEIILPSKDQYLTLGITLHELAHAVALLDKKARKPHDDGFVGVLDNLLESEQMWEEEHVGLNR